MSCHISRICTSPDKPTSVSHIISPPDCSRLEQPRFVGERPIINDFPKMSYHGLVYVSSVWVDLGNDVLMSRINGGGKKAHLELRHVPILYLCIGRIVGPRKVYPFD